MDKVSNTAKTIWFLGYPYLGVLKIFEMFPYWNSSRKKLNEFTGEDIAIMFTRRVNIAFVAFIAVMLFIYLMFRGMLPNSRWYDLIMLCIGSLLLFGGLVSRTAHITFYVEELKAKEKITMNDYFR